MAGRIILTTALAFCLGACSAKRAPDPIELVDVPEPDHVELLMRECDVEGSRVTCPRETIRGHLHEVNSLWGLAQRCAGDLEVCMGLARIDRLEFEGRVVAAEDERDDALAERWLWLGLGVLVGGVVTGGAIAFGK